MRILNPHNFNVGGNLPATERREAARQTGDNPNQPAAGNEPLFLMYTYVCVYTPRGRTSGGLHIMVWLFTQ